MNSARGPTGTLLVRISKMGEGGKRTGEAAGTRSWAELRGAGTGRPEASVYVQFLEA